MMDEAKFASLDKAIRCSILAFLEACLDEYSEGIRAGQPREECSQRLRERIQNSVVCEMIDSSCTEQCEIQYQMCINQGLPKAICEQRRLECLAGCV